MAETFTSADFSSAAASLGSGSGESSTPSGTDNSVSTENNVAEGRSEDATASSQPEANGAVGEASVGELTANADAQTANTVHEPPKERWEQILNNAREKAKAEVEAQYAWAKGIDPQEAEAVRSWMQAGNENPMNALDQLVRGIVQIPGAAPQLERYLRGLLGDSGQSQPQGQPQGQQLPVGNDMPQPDIPTDQSNGAPVVYSAPQLQKLLQWQAAQLRKEITAEFQSELGPIVQDRKLAEIKHQADEYAARAVGDISKQPGFAENKDEIAKVWNEMPRRDGRTEAERLYAAYIQVVAPKLTEKARQEAVAAVSKKAGASTINPGSGGVGTQSFDYATSSWAEALRHEAAKREKK